MKKFPLLAVTNNYNIDAFLFCNFFNNRKKNINVFFLTKARYA